MCWSNGLRDSPLLRIILFHLAQTLEADTNRRRRNQRLFRTQPWLREIPPTGANLRLQASLTIESFQDRRFKFYDCEPLRRDLHKLRVEEKSYGFRLTSPRDGEGHGDTFSAFALALLIGHELAGKRPIVLGSIQDRSYGDSFAQRQRAYDEEQAELQKLNVRDPSGFLDALRDGRVEVFGSSNPFSR